MLGKANVFRPTLRNREQFTASNVALSDITLNCDETTPFDPYDGSPTMYSIIGQSSDLDNLRDDVFTHNMDFSSLSRVARSKCQYFDSLTKLVGKEEFINEQLRK